MVSRRSPAIYADLERLPEHLTGEIIDGELFASPRPGSPHALAASGAFANVYGSFHGRGPGAGDQPGRWWILVEPELHLGPHVVVPDMAGWCHERLPKIPNTAAFTLAPDWVCEVISPRTERLDREKKQVVYRQFGVRYLWFINPLARTLETYESGERGWTLLTTFAGPAQVRAVPFDAIELDLERWWLPDDDDAPPGPNTPAALTSES
jgi:Uma2 family endonuclease